LKKRVNYLFSITIAQLEMENHEIAQKDKEYFSQNKLEEIREDYMASLLFEILKGNNGYLNEQTKEFLPVLSKYM